MDEVQGFRYLDSRDLTGFIDGTENPKGKERTSVALIGSEDPTFSGGSYVFTQRYVHNLQKWGTLPQKEQEKVIGRRKPGSEELSDRAGQSLLPPTSVESSLRKTAKNSKSFVIVFLMERFPNMGSFSSSIRRTSIFPRGCSAG